MSKTNAAMGGATYGADGMPGGFAQVADLTNRTGHPTHGVPEPPEPGAKPAMGEKPARQVRPLAKQEWTIAAMALVQALLCSTVFWPPDMGFEIGDLLNDPFGLNRVLLLLPAYVIGGFWIPGVGLTLVELAWLGAALALVGKRGRYDRTTVPLLVACLLMCLFPTLYANPQLRFLNCLVLLVVGTHTLFLVADLWPACAMGLRTQLEALRHFFASLVRHVPRLFGGLAGALNVRKQSAATEARRGMASKIGAGFVLSAVLLLLVLPLLLSADAVFASLLTDSFETVSGLHFLRELPLRAVYALALTPFLFSLLKGFTQVAGAGKPARAQAEPRRWLHGATATMVLCVLNAVYALYACVQFIYLFGGARSAAMHGGYAEYARSGFFQLVAVVAINIVVGLVVIRHGAPGRVAASGQKPEQASAPSRLVIVLTWVLVALTYVILVSAAWRMRLYVQAYGLTVLRCLTFLGMAFSAALLAELLVKSVAPGFGFFRAMLFSGLALWLAFNLANVDARIAQYNVDAYLSGSSESLDLRYFHALSPDALPALRQLEDSALDEEQERDLKNLLEYFNGWSNAPWQMQSLPYWRMSLGAGE